MENKAVNSVPTIDSTSEQALVSPPDELQEGLQFLLFLYKQTKTNLLTKKPIY